MPPKKSKSTLSHPLFNWVEQLDELTNALSAEGADNLKDHQLRKVRKSLFDITGRITETIGRIDPVRQPNSVFDPSAPDVMGRMVAMALLSQPRMRLEDKARFYGSGVYALYYRGEFEPYAPISRKDHPIYVGKADPDLANARSPIEQGEKLDRRLKEHFKSISKASNLSVDDFECRFLVVVSGWQEAAERYLISLYKPVWNKETKICYGIGKHGDSASTRGNKRSPWDTLHSGRSWAGETIHDQLSEEDIRNLLATHFAQYPPYDTREEAMDRFLEDMCQH
ncbi:Eco29kI family restriction endonuclease [Hahella aquimaris]|uniref:Eco29kI family restriction endonuclease n=1 Tax=Hahella sp. HNIBRBA332 TaxID=3015983 RepID=UPI00273C6030|nr:Eco29kI family restriction endonuclease [Hahella sp. HNIBRBA332]WLQ13313.1 Eco29kI family restriction endonuclease [Hahella sp. HNIBRBA332]